MVKLTFKNTYILKSSKEGDKKFPGGKDQEGEELRGRRGRDR